MKKRIKKALGSKESRIDFIKRVLWTAGEAFATSFGFLAFGWAAEVLSKPTLDLSGAKAFLVSALIAGGAAAVSAAKNLVFPPGSKAR